MSSKVIFYVLGQRFLEREEDRPADAKQVVYYSLAIGHHIGVIDCFKPLMECPVEGFNAWVEHLPEGEARRKLEGIKRFGEITIDATHTKLLGAALDGIRDVLNEEESGWQKTLMRTLAAIEEEPAMYLMVRRRDE